MDSIHALAKVYDSLSKGAYALDFSPSDITGDCAAQIQEIVRERKVCFFIMVMINPIFFLS